ncbi:hypothetical protein PINS_up012584 [Pythium insidiosum]|nr:hypothetical protein PINS_up012584 [Pythium insidiosum]
MRSTSASVTASSSSSPSRSQSLKSILKKTEKTTTRDAFMSESSRGTASDRRRTSAHRRALDESPTTWFRRVLQAKKLSVVDLCDLFCFGDASKHRVVPLRHACEVLFDLEPTPETNDPLTPEMEELLYQFSFPSDGDDSEIVVDIKEALRSLDLWHVRSPPPSPSSRSRSTDVKRTEDSSPAMTTMLEVKTERLQRVVAHLQQENERLKDDCNPRSPRDERVESRPPSPLAVSIKPTPTRDALTSVVTPHERDLAMLAERLQYAGVKRLEELLDRVDAERSGFVSLKELRWLLAHDLGVEISETRLMELCLGLNFNAQGLLDHKELTRLLQDVLLYEPRSSFAAGTSPSSSKSHKHRPLDRAVLPSLRKVRAYLEGLQTTRSRCLALLSSLCDKYDLEGDARISLVELARVLLHDVPQQHPVRLPFPLSRDDTSAMLQRLTASTPHEQRKRERERDSETPFVYYPDVLHALVGADDDHDHDGDSAEADDEDDDDELHRTNATARGVDAAFWLALRRALGGDDRHAARDVHQQLCKILLKLDPQRRFAISARHFRRVFDQHWSERDMALVLRALGTASGVRYDVLLKLVFGAPELRDRRALDAIVPKLSPWRASVSRLMTQHGSAFRLSLPQYFELARSVVVGNACDSASQEQRRQRGVRLSTMELLFVFAWLDDRHAFSIELGRLWGLLSSTTSPRSKSESESKNRSSGSSESPLVAREFEHLRRRLRRLCDPPCELETTLQRELATRYDGVHVVKVEELARFLVAQLAATEKETATTKTTMRTKTSVSTETVNRFLRAIAASSVDGVADTDDGKSSTSSWLSVASLMDALVDWTALAATMRLPERLVDVKRTLELFDWHRSGDIDVQDWPKAWRQIAVSGTNRKAPAPPLREWELRVLCRRFASAGSPVRRRSGAASSSSSSPESQRLDYARLLVFLMDVAQRERRERALHVVRSMLRRRLLRQQQQQRRPSHVTTRDVERAFTALDRDEKGYFTRADLYEFVRRELEAGKGHEEDDEEDRDDDELEDEERDRELLRRELASNGAASTVLESVFSELLTQTTTATTDAGHGSSRQRASPSDVVTLLRFQQLVPLLLPDHNDHNDSVDGGERREHSASTRHSHQQPKQRTHVTTLRALEDAVREISSRCVDATSHVSPARAFKVLSAVGDDRERVEGRRPRSQSPSRRLGDEHHSSRRLQPRRASCDSPVSLLSRAESPASISAGELDPLTPKRLQRTLRQRYALEVSTYLLGQFFLHLGAPTSHFLELTVFARWLAPLSAELQSHGVRRAVHAMLVKGKAGGGQLDLERFLSLLERRLEALDRTSERERGGSPAGGRSPPSVVLTALHQLNVPLRQNEWVQLLRHFGMEDQRVIDVRRVVRLLYELDATSTRRS